MSILIQTVANDMHAAAVMAALRSLDVPTLLSVGTQVPSRQAMSYFTDGTSEELAITRDGCSRAIGDTIDLVWSRRARICDTSALHPDDRALAEREFELFIEGFWDLVPARAVWINPWSARLLANTKSVQLRLARQCGFAIAPSLFSNDPARIRAFVAQHGPGQVVYKTFSPISWDLDHGGCLATPTSIVPQSLLEDAEALQSCPGIYQVLIRKAREYRVTVMGEAVYCVELLLDQDQSRSIDWRIEQADLAVREVGLPDRVASACRRIARALDLAFGCIDLIEDTNGDWYFIEINEMGQFLWIEQNNPELPYLRHFASFLLSTMQLERDVSALALGPVLAGPDYREILEAELGSSVLSKECDYVA